MISDRRLLQEMVEADTLFQNAISVWDTTEGKNYLEAFKTKMGRILSEVDERIVHR